MSQLPASTRTPCPIHSLYSEPLQLHPFLPCFVASQADLSLGLKDLVLSPSLGLCTCDFFLLECSLFPASTCQTLLHLWVSVQTSFLYRSFPWSYCLDLKHPLFTEVPFLTISKWIPLLSLHSICILYCSHFLFVCLSSLPYYELQDAGSLRLSLFHLPSILSTWTEL